jgi:hypothetical protein
MHLHRQLLIAAALGISLTSIVNAGMVTTTNPNVSSEIGARIRWGGNNFEGSVYDSNNLNQNPTLNPGGAPAWALNQPYGFKVSFDSATGTLALSIDFNRNDSFGDGESISRSTFAAPGATSYAGQGFKYLSISGNESGSTARSQVTDLVINGTSFSTMAPGGLFLENFYKDSGDSLVADWMITGKITYLTAGTNQERPGWDFRFRDAAVVPEPSTYIAGGLALLPLLFGLRARFQRK